MLGNVSSRSIHIVAGSIFLPALLVGLVFVSNGVPVNLLASQRNGQIIRTTGPDPRHVCAPPRSQAGPATADPAPIGASGKHHAQGDATLTRLNQETKTLLAEISAKHRQLMQTTAGLTVERHLFVLDDTAYEINERSEAIGERMVVAMRYDNSEFPGELRCVIFDHTIRNHDDPARWIRRIVRVYAPEGGNDVVVHFETLARGVHELLYADELEYATRLRVSRRILRELRDVSYLIDRTAPAQAAHSEPNPF